MKIYKNIPIVMTIAGSDSGGGAGIQADLKTIAAIGGYGTSVVTALTAQNSIGVDGIFPVPIDFIEKQFNSIMSDFNVQSIKTGMLPDINTIKCVAKLIKNSGIKNYVLDPVMIATSGDKLISENTINTIIDELIPLSKVITPNIPEAELLLNKKLESINDMENFALELLKFGSNAVLLKGGHLNKEKIIDVFVANDLENPIIIKKNKINTNNTHGTGCTLSACLTTLLPKQYNWKITIDLLSEYMYKVIYESSKFNICKGNGPLWHFISSNIL